MTGAEYLKWCKDRALEYADQGDAGLAMSSLIQDLSRHPATESSAHIVTELMMPLVMGGASRHAGAASRVHRGVQLMGAFRGEGARAAAVSNRADDAKWTGELARGLRAHVDAHAEGMPRPAAVAWVYMTVLAAWAEDHGLIMPFLRQAAAPARDAYMRIVECDIRGWLAQAIAALGRHPGTWTLLDPAWVPQLRQGMPPERACRDLADWWAGAPSLRYDVQDGPGSLTGWVPGDMIQHLSDERRKGYALCQTPWWICDFILDETLVPACQEFRGDGDEPVRLIDPACGTGHFLVRAISYLYEWYTTGTLRPRQAKSAEPATGGTPLPAAEAIRRILAGVHGCDRDPLTAAVARLRYTVAIGDLMRRAGISGGALRLDRIPQFQVAVVPGDSLLARLPGFSQADYARLHPDLARIINLGMPDERPQPAQGTLFGDDELAAGPRAS